MFANKPFALTPETSTVDSTEALSAEEIRGYAGVLDCYAEALGITKYDILADMVRLRALNNRKAVTEVLSRVR